MKDDQQRTIYLKDYRPSDYLIDAAGFDIALHATQTRVTSTLTMRPNPAAGKKPAVLKLNAENLQVESIHIDGALVSHTIYQIDAAWLTIHEPPSSPFVLTIVSVCDPQSNKALSGLYVSRGIYCTQCEAEGFRRIAPYLDRPDVLAKFRVRLEADKAAAPVLLGNGNLIESGDIGGGRHFAVWDDPHPKPSYLFALVGGNLAHIQDEFVTSSGRKVDLRIYAEPGKEERCWWAMDSLKRSMAWDEKRFGLEYDLDIFMIVAVSDFNMGAMENKGLNIFNDKLILAAPETATDSDYEHIEAVVAHEYFHNWTGNRVTCRDWFQLCLKEGLTVFRDQEFTSDERSRALKRIGDVRLLRSRQFPEDGGPLAHPVRPDSFIEINNFYTLTVYEKGAELCRMLQTLVGVEGFRKGIDLYFERHDGQAVTVEDFLAAIADANGADLEQFKLWYSQAGTPALNARFTYSTAEQSARLTLTQTLSASPGQTKKKPQQIPVKLGLVGKNGDDLPLRLGGGGIVENSLIQLRKRRETFVFEGLAERPTLSLLRDFSAPVKLTTDLKDADLLFLMAHDSNAFNRWEAGRTLAMRLLITASTGLSPKPRMQGAFIEALGKTLADESLDAAYRTAFAALPSELDIASAIGHNVDPEAIHTARQAFRAKIGKVLAAPLISLYETLVAIPGETYSPDAASAGARALRNTALSYLVAGGGKTGLKMAKAHYDAAQNMTDTMAALAILASEDTAASKAAFADFYERWKDDHLVIDKWFAMQATSHAANAVSRVRKLTQHPLFNITNPNKVRSVYGAFAHGNQVRFNDASGEGYALLASAIIELDGFNPQVAARMAGAFENWRMFEPGRQALAQKAIQSIAAKPDLSPDTDEIVSKILS
ncbi:MAG: aminopeptidase N [Chitinophagales bacterium]|nr:aminopeptidase N [Hyphomicrobiales bacterium]